MEYIGELFQGLTLQSELIDHATFEDCTFEGCTFTDVKLRHCRLTDCTFRACTIQNPSFSYANAMGTVLEKTTLMGVVFTDLIDERLRSMHLLPFDRITECNLRHCVFYSMSLKAFQFTGCDLTGSSFDDCDLEKASFASCELQNTALSHCNLSGADFRSARNYFFSVESNQMQGAKFSLPDAVNLLPALGIELSN